jgi:hypothetical protein
MFGTESSCNKPVLTATELKPASDTHRAIEDTQKRNIPWGQGNTNAYPSVPKQLCKRS